MRPLRLCGENIFNGLVPGKRYAFRIRALGPNELESPWSDEVSCMAP